MIPIVPPVNQDSIPEAIANLQTGLQLLGLQIDPTEAGQRIYNDTTRRAVIMFQQMNRITEAPGFVGEQTAKRLNAMLKERGAFEDRDMKVEGQVVESESNSPVGGAKLEAWGKESAGDALLIAIKTDGEGKFSFARKESVVEKYPAIYFKVYDGSQLLVDTKDKIEWRRTDTAPQVIITVKNEPAAATEGVVSGNVVTKEGVALDGVVVRAFSKSIDQDTQIGDDKTNKSGAFTIRYKTAVSSGDAPDIEVRAYNQGESRAATELGRSDIKYNAGAAEALNIIVDPEKVSKPHEYGQLTQDVRRHLGQLSLKDLQEGDGKTQVTYLANKTGWDVRMIAMSVQAEKLSAENGIPAEHYYALFRAGVTNDPVSIGKLTPQAAEGILKKAAEQKLIPEDNRIAESVKAIGNLNVNFLLSNSFASGVSSLSNMLSLRLTEDQKKVFAQTAQTIEDDPKALWSSLRQRGFDDATIQRLQLDGKMGYLTNQNAPLIKRIYDAHGINDPVDLVRNGYYKPEAWTQMIGNDVPEGVSAANYAQHLSAQIALNYPTSVAAEMVMKDEVKLQGQFDKQDVYGFFTRNEQKFTLGSQPVRNWEGFNALSTEGKRAAKTVERMFQLSPSNEAMSTLSNLGLTSAWQITKMSKDEFMEAYGQQFTNTEEAELTYNKASEVHSAVMNVATAYLTYRTLPNVYALTGKLRKTDTEIVAYPTLEELFGNMDYCACDHCRSVLSPAAYLVDLLQFIDLTGVPHDKQNPIDVLLGRRPDIQHIQLSCENTNVALPYIDLVNEILEHYVVNGNLTTFKGHDITEDTETADLLADPQYVIEAAYTEVKTKVYPYNLPFDYPLEALRLLFNAWDVSLTDSLKIFRTPADARKEVLALNSDEYRILTDKAFHALPEHFGEAPATTIAVLNAIIANGKTFSHRTNISYEELVMLLKTEFINPGVVLVPLLQKLPLSLQTLQSFYDGTTTDAQLDPMLPADLDQELYGGDVKAWLRNNQSLIIGMITLTDVGEGGTECNFADVQLRFALPDSTQNSLTELAYHKLNRFVRLWKKLDWSIDVTDDVVTTLLHVPSQAITDANIDDVFTTLLARIAALKTAMELLGASKKKIPDFIVLWDTTKTLSFRQEAAAKLLKARVEDLQSLSTITGFDPLAADLENDRPSLIQFIETMQALKKISLKVADLTYLLRHVDDTGKLMPAEETLLKNIKVLRDGLNAIDRDHSVAPDNADFAFAKTKMALVYDNAIVNEFFGLLTAERSYQTAFNTIEEGLPTKLIAADANLGYDPFKKELTYQGILSTAARTALEGVVDALVVGDMGVITQTADLTTFKTDIKAALQSIETAGTDELAAFAVDYPELKTVYDAVKAQADPAAQTTALLNGILPELVARLKAAALRQMLTAVLKTDADTVAVLTEKKEVLQAAGNNTQSVLFDFLQLQQQPVFSNNQMYSFYLDAPATDGYLLYAKAPQNTVITLSIDGVLVLAGVTVGASGEVKNASPLALTTGVLHKVDLTIASLSAAFTVELFWRTKGMTKTAIPAAFISVAQNIDFAKASLIRLQKASSLGRLLKLTPRELRYFSSQNAETTNLLNELTTTDAISDVDLHNVWNKLNAVVYFAGLKKDTEEEENTWVQMLENPSALNAQGKSILLSLNYWNQTDLDAVLTQFGLNLSDLSLLSNLQKVMAAMNLVITINYPAASVISWSTPSPTTALIKEIKDAIKAVTNDAAYLETMQTVSDALRNKQRDALVSYVLYHRKPSPEVNTADKLYEYFLIDVQMDACMKTSRIRQALSTVQLFIHRCLMNLEPDVAPASIRAAQWVWMSRYRVWEANRKVFLYPENWLEPELRDGKSSFFRELEGELLQADITDDLAELAFLNYLKKLDDVARLEIVGMYLEENEKGNQDDDILHVFGCTNGTTRQYYYRRYEYGYWTPWEKITLNIEGDLVFPVVWKKRLFLFWMSIVEKPADGDKTKKPKDMGDQPWGDNAKMNVEMTMCWGEYYKNKWTSPKSSDLSKPMLINGITSFTRSQLTICARKEKKAGLSERLIFNVFYRSYNRDFAVTYTSKNAPPIIEVNVRDSALYNGVRTFNEDLYRRSLEMGPVAVITNNNSFEFLSRDFKILVNQPPLAKTDVRAETIIQKSGALFSGFRVLPLRHIVENQWEAPLFYNDEQNTFFIKPTEVLRQELSRFEGYYDDIFTDKTQIYEIPPLVEQTIPHWPPKGEIFNPGDAVSNPWEWNETVVNKNENFKRIISTEHEFQLGEVTFGAGGKGGVLNSNIANGGFNY